MIMARELSIHLRLHDENTKATFFCASQRRFEVRMNTAIVDRMVPLLLQFAAGFIN